MYLSQQCLTKSMSVHLRNKAADKDLRSHTDQGTYERTQSGKKEKDRNSTAISLNFFFFFTQEDCYENPMLLQTPRE